MENNRNYEISGASVETMDREKSDKLLLNAIESERNERLEATREIQETLTHLGLNDVVIYDKLRNHETTLNFLIGFGIGLLISMILIAWQI